MVRNPDGVEGGIGSIRLDGQPVSGKVVPLVDDGGTHEIDVEMGGPAAGE
jgi:cellobiose phosphorylase